MTRRYGIDTSVLVRLATGDPEADFSHVVSALMALVDAGDECQVSNQVIGEAYIALQHHYGLSKRDARVGITGVLQSHLVEPMGGQPVFECLAAQTGCGLVDRLIVDDYRRAGMNTLTCDKRMAALPHAHLL